MQNLQKRLIEDDQIRSRRSRRAVLSYRLPAHQCAKYTGVSHAKIVIALGIFSIRSSCGRGIGKRKEEMGWVGMVPSRMQLQKRLGFSSLLVFRALFPMGSAMHLNCLLLLLQCSHVHRDCGCLRLSQLRGRCRHPGQALPPGRPFGGLFQAWHPELFPVCHRCPVSTEFGREMSTGS